MLCAWHPATATIWISHSKPSIFVLRKHSSREEAPMLTNEHTIVANLQSRGFNKREKSVIKVSGPKPVKVVLVRNISEQYPQHGVRLQW
jgi:hypothetical protein